MRKFFSQNPPFIALWLGLLLLLSRLPFRSQILYDWDSVDFALGIVDFNITKHQPHPPGYILYILASRLLNGFTHDSNASMVWLSISASILTVIFTYKFTREIFSHNFAIASSLLLITNPLLWYYDELAYTYSIEACFSLLVAYSCYKAIQGSEKWAYVGAVVFGIGGGLRQSTLLILFPLVLFTFFRLKLRTKVIASFLLTIPVIIWGLLLIQWAGGLSSYLTDFIHLSSTVDPEPLGLLAHSLFYAGHIPLLLAFGFWFRLYPISTGHQTPWMKWFLALWLIPGILVAGFVHIGESGYILYLLPALAMYTPPMVQGILHQLEGKHHNPYPSDGALLQKKYLLSISAILIINVVSFLFGGAQLIKKNDKIWLDAQHYVDTYLPNKTIILVRLIDFRHACYYLPEYHIYAFDAVRLKGPFLLPHQDYVHGWIFTCYQHQDNYSLNPDDHQLFTSIDLPENVHQILTTSDTLLNNLMEAMEKYNSQESEVQILNERFAYVRLPQQVVRISVSQGRLELEENFSHLP